MINSTKITSVLDELKAMHPGYTVMILYSSYNKYESSASVCVAKWDDAREHVVSTWDVTLPEKYNKKKLIAIVDELIKNKEKEYGTDTV